jgi:hypothetical protein
MMQPALSRFGLIFTWVVIFFVLVFVTELTLAPWDTAIERPEVGTWQRTLNDFFERTPGNMSLAALLIVASILTLRRRPARLQWVAGNLIFVGLLFSVFMVAALVNNAVFPYPPVSYDPTYHGYHRSVIPGLAVLLVCAGWLIWQVRAAPAPNA